MKSLSVSALLDQINLSHVIVVFSGIMVLLLIWFLIELYFTKPVPIRPTLTKDLQHGNYPVFFN